MLSFKSVSIILVVLTILSFATGYIGLGSTKSKCLLNRQWTFSDNFYTWLAFGRLEFRYRPVNFVCPPDAQYDPAKYKAQGGILVPIDNSQ